MKKHKNFRLSENVIETLERSVKELNEYVNYDEYNVTDFLEKLVMRYSKYLVQVEKEKYDNSLPGAIDKMTRCK